MATQTLTERSAAQANPQSYMPVANTKALLGAYRVRLTPDLSAAAFRQHQVDQLALWYCLRAINHWGSAVLDTEGALQALIDTFGYSRRTVYRQLAKGKGVFWTVIPRNGTSRIYIHGISKVASLLQIQWTQRYFREVSVEGFNTHSKRSAELYASIHKPEGVRANPMSRACITAMTGLSKCQQRRYEVEAGVKRTANYAVIFQGIGRSHTVEPEKITVEGKSREYTINKRLGNIYHTRQSMSRKGQLKRLGCVSKRVRSSIGGEALQPLKKRFFKSYKALVRVLSRRGEEEHQGYYLVNNGYRSIKGRLEWCSYGVYV